MVETKVCTFCGGPIEPGTGKMYAKKDGTVYLFCKNKCKKNLIDLKRVPRKTRWTQAYAKETGRGRYTKRKKRTSPEAE